jgi:hypothetical protein
MLRLCALSLVPFLLGACVSRKAMLHSAETTPPPEWQQRVDRHRAITQKVFAETGEFSPLVAYVMPDGREDLAFLSFPPEAKQRTIAGVTRKARDSKCRGLILVGDSWTAPPIPGRKPQAGDAINHPQRQECLLFSLFTPAGAWAREVRYQRKGKKIAFQPPGPWFKTESPWNPWEQLQ